MKQRILCVLFAILLAIPILAYAGTLTMSTYYPAPTGNYDNLQANNIGVGTASVGNTLKIAGEGTGYATIGNSGCGNNYTGLSLGGTPMASCLNYNLLSRSSGDLFINRPSGGNIYFRENNNDQMLLASGGNFGIGNTNPGEKLDVNGKIKWGSNLLSVDQGGSIELGDSTLAAGSATPYIDFHYGIGAAQDYNARIINNADSALAFKTSSGGEVLTIKGSNVGIGNAAPAQKLDVTGNANISGNLGIGNTLKIAGEGTGYATIGNSGCGSNFTGLSLGGAPMASCLNYNLLSISSGDLFINRPAGGTTYFRMANNSQMTLNNNGNLGIGLGDTAASATLQVRGSTMLGGNVDAPISYTNPFGVSIGDDTTDFLPTGQTRHYTLELNAKDVSSIGFLDQGSSIGSIRYTSKAFTIGADDGWGKATVYFPGNVGIGGAPSGTYNLYVTGSIGASGEIWGGSFNYSSDRRLKENIRPLKDALKKTIALNGVSFDWKKNKHHSIGLIAQDVEKVIPEIVSTDKEGMKSVAYGNIVAVLIEAVKSQQQEIEKLQHEVASLKNKIK